MANVYCDANLTTGANNGTSWGDALQGANSIQTAINMAHEGDTINVEKGTYNHIEIPNAFGISIISRHGPDFTTIDATGQTNSLSVLGSLNQDYNSGTQGYGIDPGFCRAITQPYSTTLAWGTAENHLVFVSGFSLKTKQNTTGRSEDHSLPNGTTHRHFYWLPCTVAYGLYLHLDNCKIIDNRSLCGLFRVYALSNSIIKNNYIGSLYSGGYAGESVREVFTEYIAKCYNNLFVENTIDMSYNPGITWISRAQIFTNNTIANNKTHTGSYDFSASNGCVNNRWQSSQKAIIANNICQIKIHNGGYSSATNNVIAYNYTPSLDESALVGNYVGNIYGTTPELDSDYHIKANSKCLYSGNREYLQSENDLEGNPFNQAPSMGCFEFGAKYNKIIYCDANLTTGANDGTSWANAYRGAGSLLTAIQKAVNNDVILVKNGNYSPIDYQTIKTISIIGESRDGCIIDGGAQFSVPNNLMEIGYLSAINITKTGVCCARFNGSNGRTPSISVENFTFQNGQSTNTASSWGAGGVKGAILKNCIVKNCLSLSAQYAHGAGLIFCNAYNTIISNCIAAQGGGVFDSNLYDCSVLNCIGGGISSGYTTHGGGMYNDSQKTILSNCLFDGCSVVNGYAAAGDFYSGVSAYNVEVCNCYNNINGQGRAVWLETTSNYAFNCKFHDTQNCDFCTVGGNLICCDIYNCKKPFSSGSYEYCKIHDFYGSAGATTSIKNSEIYNGYNDNAAGSQMFGQAGVWTNCYLHDISMIISSFPYNAGIKCGGDVYNSRFENILLKSSVDNTLKGAILFGNNTNGCTFDHCSAACILNGQHHINDEIKNCNVAVTASGSNALLGTTSHPQRIINAKIHHNRANFVYAGNLKPQGYFRNCTFANNELSNSSGDCLWSNGWYNGGSSTLPADDQCYGMVENCVFYGNSVYPSKKYDMEFPYRMRIRNCCIEPDTLTVTYAQGEQQGVKMNNWSTTYSRDNSMIPENCIVADPMFNDPDNYDYTLKDGSPCIKTGVKDLDFYDPMYIQLNQPTNRLLYRLSAYAPFDCEYHLWEDGQPSIGAHGDVITFSKGLPNFGHPLGGNLKKKVLK